MTNQAASGQLGAANRMDNSTAISGTSYQNMRADEIIKKYHVSNSEAQSKVYSARGHGTVSPRQLDFDRNIGTAVGNLNNSFVSATDTFVASANMSIGSSRQQTNRDAMMENML